MIDHYSMIIDRCKRFWLLLEAGFAYIQSHTMPFPPTPRITGSTAVYLILGDPVEQVRAPESFNLIFSRLGIDAVLVPVRVAPTDLTAFVQAVFQAPNIQGLWLTIPHKAAVLPLLAHCTARAQTAQAVNAVRREADGRLSGDLFDGEGFAQSLVHYGMPWVSRKVLLIGAGGAACAIGATLAHGPQACRELALYDPVPGRSSAAVALLGRGAAARVVAVPTPDPAGYDLVVNCSPLGLSNSDPLPCDLLRMDAGSALVDILMKNQPTPLVRAARARGLQAEPGFEMMIQQTHLYLEFFGFAEAAAALRDDLDFVREAIYPDELRGAWRLAA